MIKIVKEHITYQQKYSFMPWFFWNWRKIKDKSITHNIFRIQYNESIMCRFYCIAFIEYMPVGKALLDYTTLFSPNDYIKNDKIICKYFKDKYGRKSKSRV